MASNQDPPQLPLPGQLASPGVPSDLPQVPERNSDSDTGGDGINNEPQKFGPRPKSGDPGRARRASSARSQSRPPHTGNSYGGFGRISNSRDKEDWWDDNDFGDRDVPRGREEPRHPDHQYRRASHSRPPRAFLNRQSNDMGNGNHTPSKSFFEETRSNRGGPMVDEEMGYPLRARPTWKELSDQEKMQVLRLPMTQWMNSNFKNHFVATLGEFIGTTLFLFFAFGGTEVANIQSQANNNTNSSDSNTTTGGSTGFDVSVLLYISVIFGMSLMVNVWIFFRISGGLFNPAVTLAMVMVKAISVTRAVCLFFAQMLGSMLASVVVRFLFPEKFNVRTTLSGGTSQVQGVFIEAILTAELVFTIFMMAKEKHRATYLAPVCIGMALFIAEMVGVQFTGGSLNPARSFGPCVVTLTFDEEHWIYWIGPLIGSILAVAFYKFIKTLEYEMANPGADGDPTNDPTINPEKKAEILSRRRSSSTAR
ncbi:MIP family channel protein [Apiospora arundinis]|uniref:MIP family channel protein n=1 Tax=Apiospora arundinis TaxID=335852 RepID=A0ABR2IFB4_9PEZI